MLYTKDHEWINIEGNIGTVGITKYAAEQLGDITYVELPEIGAQVNQFEILCSIESVKAASDVYAPLSGRVTEINEALEGAPEIINRSPEADGWIAKIEIINMDENEALMKPDAYQEYLKGLE